MLTPAISSIQALHLALAAATFRDLPDIIYEDRDWAAYEYLRQTLPREQFRAQVEAGDLPKVKRGRRPAERDCEVRLFLQTWGSTALGYGGIGGAAITRAYTVVVFCNGVYCVYFGGDRLAYRVAENCSSPEQLKLWIDDLNSPTGVSSCEEAMARYGAKPKGDSLSPANWPQRTHANLAQKEQGSFH